MKPRIHIAVALAIGAVAAASAATGQDRSAADRAQTRAAERAAIQQLPTTRNLPPSEAARAAPRVIGGSDADVAGLYEFTGSIKIPRFPHWCGGSFLRPRIEAGADGKKYVAEWINGSSEPTWFITAAHCIANLDGVAMDTADITIIGGVRDISAGGGAQVIKVDEVVKHPDYLPRNPDAEAVLANDIALLRLGPIPAPAVGSPAKIRTITLPDTRQASLIYQEGARMDVNGWGSTGANPVSLYLQTAMVPYGDQERCEDAYSDIAVEIADGAFCAGWTQGGIDACQGDSGEPIFFGGHPSFSSDPILTGVVSWGEGCALPNYLGVYSSTLYFQKWMETEILKRS